jgi:hypothetical protein
MEEKKQEQVQVNNNSNGTVASNNVPQPPKPKPQQNAPQPQAVPTPSKEGFNLIPALTKEEKVKIKKKNTLNIGSILSLIFLAVIALGIVGFNITAKTQANRRASVLARTEKKINDNIDKIISNNVILERIDLYLDVKENSFSHRKIIEFLTATGDRIGDISFTSIEISEDLSFELSGKAPSLERLSRLWYLFGVDENLNTINLNSVSKSDEGANFSFEGEFNIKNFTKE